MLRHLFVAVVALLIAIPAFAEDAKAAAAPAAEVKKDEAKPAADAKPAAEPKKEEKKAEAKKAPADPLAAFGGWRPQPVKKKDVKGLKKFLKAWEKSRESGPESVANHVSFPVHMVTTNSKREVVTAGHDKDAFIKSMKMPPEAGALMAKVKTAKPKFTWITDEIVFVAASHRLRAGKKNYKWNSGLLLVNLEGNWMVKEMIEGGWGDPPADAGDAPAATEGTE